MDILYENIKKRREELGKSQTYLAIQAGYNDRSAVAKIESGRIDLPYSKILAIAQALNTDPVTLMGLDPVSRYDLPVVHLDDFETAVIMRLRALLGEQQQFIEHILIREYDLVTKNDPLRNVSLLNSIMDDISERLGGLAGGAYK